MKLATGGTKLEEGQSPSAVIVGCSDSRVPPELIFDQGFGDLFVVRVAGNIVDTDVTASVEYAVDHLQTHLIVVSGTHQLRCGDGDARPLVQPWQRASRDPLAVLPNRTGLGRDEFGDDQGRADCSRSQTELSSWPSAGCRAFRTFGGGSSAVGSNWSAPSTICTRAASRCWNRSRRSRPQDNDAPTSRRFRSRISPPSKMTPFLLETSKHQGINGMNRSIVGMIGLICLSSSASAETAPNILLILTDDHGWRPALQADGPRRFGIHVRVPSDAKHGTADCRGTTVHQRVLPGTAVHAQRDAAFCAGRRLLAAGRSSRVPGFPQII